MGLHTIVPLRTAHAYAPVASVAPWPVVPVDAIMSWPIQSLLYSVL